MFPYLAYIQSGAFRVYFINGLGQELTTWFSFAGMMVTDMLAYYKNKKTTFSRPFALPFGGGWHVAPEGASGCSLLSKDGVSRR